MCFEQFLRTMSTHCSMLCGNEQSISRSVRYLLVKDSCAASEVNSLGPSAHKEQYLKVTAIVSMVAFTSDLFCLSTSYCAFQCVIFAHFKIYREWQNSQQRYSQMNILKTKQQKNPRRNDLKHRRNHLKNIRLLFQAVLAIGFLLFQEDYFVLN